MQAVEGYLTILHHTARALVFVGGYYKTMDFSALPFAALCLLHLFLIVRAHTGIIQARIRLASGV